MVTILRQQGWLNPQCCLVEDYHTELHDPAGYVQRLTDCTQCNPSAQQVEAAIANITPELFRFKLEELPEEIIAWDKSWGPQAPIIRCSIPC